MSILLDMKTYAERLALHVKLACLQAAQNEGGKASAGATINFVRAPKSYYRMARAGGYELGRLQSDDPILDTFLPLGFQLIPRESFSEVLAHVKRERLIWLNKLEQYEGDVVKIEDDTNDSSSDDEFDDDFEDEDEVTPL